MFSQYRAMCKNSRQATDTAAGGGNAAVTCIMSALYSLHPLSSTSSTSTYLPGLYLSYFSQAVIVRDISVLAQKKKYVTVIKHDSMHPSNIDRIS